jgi:regulator of RNase E activity RraA
LAERVGKLSPTTWADVLERSQILDLGIHPLWSPMPRLAGLVFPVRCPPGDNLMLHAAIYRAPKGAVIVAEAGDNDFALAGGNVCATAQKHGVAGFVIDGVIRDLAEVRALRFPVLARGVSPKPGKKEKVDVLGNGPVRCGGVTVHPGDWLVADEEGAVVIPGAQLSELLVAAEAKAAKDAAQSLEDWERSHRANIDAALKAGGLGG